MNPSDYDRIEPSDKISIVGLKEIVPGKPLRGIIHKAKTGEKLEISLKQTMNENQIGWFKAGSALNAMAATNSK